MPDAAEIRASARRQKAADLLAEGDGEHGSDEDATSRDYLLARLIVAVEALEERLTPRRLGMHSDALSAPARERQGRAAYGIAWLAARHLPRCAARQERRFGRC